MPKGDKDSNSRRSFADKKSSRGGHREKKHDYPVVGPCDRGCSDSYEPLAPVVCPPLYCADPFYTPCGLTVKPLPCIMADVNYRSLYYALYQSMFYARLYDQLNTMLTTNTAAAYTTFLSQIITSFNVTIGSPSPRVLVALSDGKVVIDTSVPPSAPNANTFANYTTGDIGENHNTRVAIMSAQQQVNGVSYETKYSTTTGTQQAYVAMRAGPFRNSAGTIRLSVNVGVGAATNPYIAQFGSIPGNPYENCPWEPNTGSSNGFASSA